MLGTRPCDHGESVQVVGDSTAEQMLVSGESGHCAVAGALFVGLRVLPEPRPGYVAYLEDRYFSAV